MAEDKNGNCCNSALDKALKVTVILFLAYIMLGGLFVFAAIALRGHDRIQMMRNGGVTSLLQKTDSELPCGCSLKGAVESTK
jgi:hypothetical protein